MSKQIEKIQKKKRFDDGFDFEPRRKSTRGHMEQLVYEHENVLNNITTSDIKVVKHPKVYFVTKVEKPFDLYYYNKDEPNEYILISTWNFLKSKKNTLYRFDFWLKDQKGLSVKSAKWLTNPEKPEIIFFDESDTRLHKSTDEDGDVLSYHGCEFTNNFIIVKKNCPVVVLELQEYERPYDVILPKLLEEAKQLGINFENKTNNKNAVRLLKFLIKKARGEE